jgi:hypothetical protein
VVLQLGNLVASQLNRLTDAVRLGNDFNICIVLHEANLLLSNPANQDLIDASKNSPAFELCLLRLWSIVEIELGQSRRYGTTVTEYAGALSRVLQGVIKIHFLDGSLRPAAQAGVDPPHKESIDA